MTIKSNLITLACQLGGFRVARLMTRTHPRVLMYHRFSAEPSGNKVSADLFDQQISEIKNNFNVLPLSIICEYLRRGNPAPHNSIVLTIDDGYDDFYQFAFPVLKKHGIPATLYVTADFVDRKLWLWPDKIAYILKTTRVNNLTFTPPDKITKTLPLYTDTDRSSAWETLNSHCLSIGHDERQLFIRQLAQNLFVTINPEPVLEYAPMTWSAVRELSENGIEIGAHSCTHPVLSNLDRNNLWDEIYGSKKRIEEVISKPVSAFCYPNGGRDDYNALVKQVVIESGFSSATVAFHDKSVWQDLFEIRRYGVGLDMVQFRKALYGVESLSDSIR
jgi:peptidoglycan/xylan/chitin deacetylase (PgdA/CDA1 family)